MTDLVDLSEMRLTHTQWVAATPERTYELISDVGAMAAWSPNLVWARYDEGQGPAVGSMFTGRNKDQGHEWETRVRVIEAEPATAFSWVVLYQERPVTRWSYTFQSVRGGTFVEESWRVFRLIPLLGSTAEEVLELRASTSKSMATTLAALAASLTDTNSAA